MDHRAARAAVWRSAAWRWASAGPAALRAVWRTGLVPRGATDAAGPPRAELCPPGLDGASGALPPKPAASFRTVCLVGSNVGASSAGRMPSRGGC